MKMKLRANIMVSLTIFVLFLSLRPYIAAAQDLPEHHVFLPLMGGGSQSSTTYSNGDIWKDVSEAATLANEERWVVPQKYRLIAADMPHLDAVLASTHLKQTEVAQVAQNSEIVLDLPLPDGTLGRFRIENSPIMEPELAAKFPQIKTYSGWGLDDPTAVARLDRTPAGFHAMILSNSDTVYIDPYRRGDITLYTSYYKRDYGNYWGKSFIEETPLETGDAQSTGIPGVEAARSGPTLRTYRLALAATGEYTQFHNDNNPANGDAVADALAAMVTTMNRVNGIYRRDLSVQVNLIGNTDQLISIDGNTDPYTNNDGSAMLGENQANIDAVIGGANYDIGHVFSTGGGGIARLGVVCDNTNKGRGVTGSEKPIGDPFDVDFVAHEMGHQFGANHTFNASTAGSCNLDNINGGTAYEPGSGTTIMSYAGICSGQDLQSHSDDHFHAASIGEIINYITVGAGSSCGTTTATGNTMPTVGAGPNYTIPRQTPFSLIGTGSDTDGDTLTFTWEEFNTGAAWANTNVLPNNDADGNARPIFRSYPPTTTAVRTFPRLDSILDGSNSNNGESLPNIDRTMSFRLTVRDGRGGVNDDDMRVTVEDAAGPFAVTSPNTALTWHVETQQNVTWDVAGTDASPVSCANVNILLSTNGGQTFPIMLAANTANDGIEMVTLPEDETNVARIKIVCADNIFFDISDADIMVIRSADLAITMTESPDPVIAGEQVFYEITVRNLGPDRALDVVVTDTLPLGVNYVTSTTPCTVAAPSVVTCNLGNLSVGQERSFTLKAIADPNLAAEAGNPTVIVNTVTIATPAMDPDITNNTAEQSTIVEERSDLRATKDCKPDRPVPAGTAAICTIIIENLGPSTARNVSVVDTYLSNDAFQFGAVSPELCSAPEGVQMSRADITCTVGNLPKGARFVLELTVTADEPQDISGYTTISSDTPDPDPTNSQAHDSVTVAAVTDLELTKLHTPDPIIAGELFTYTLVITNHGPSTAHDVVVTDLLPSEVRFESVQAADGRCTLPTGEPNQVVCNLTALAKNAATSVTIMVHAEAERLIRNVAQVTGKETDPNLANNIVLEESPAIRYYNFIPLIHDWGPSAEPDLIVSLRLDPDRREFAAGESVQLTVVVTNQGTAAAAPFWTDLFISPSTAPVAANTIWSRVCSLTPCLGIAWFVERGLHPGESIVLTSTDDSFAAGHTIWPGWFAAGTTDLYVYVDSYGLSSPSGAVVESDENNNRDELHDLIVTGVNPAQVPDASMSTLPDRTVMSDE